MTTNRCLAIVLAAGKGTRMRSARPKVLHEVAGKPMVGHALDAAREAGASDLAVVVGHGGGGGARGGRSCRDVPASRAARTAHAVLAAREAIGRGPDEVLVLYGDTPLLTGASLRVAREALTGDVAVAVVGFEATDPTGYGRLLTDGRRARGDPRGEGREPRRARGELVQLRHHGPARGPRARPARRRGIGQRQRRVLPDGRGRDRPLARARHDLYARAGG